MVGRSVTTVKAEAIRPLMKMPSMPAWKTRSNTMLQATFTAMFRNFNVPKRAGLCPIRSAAKGITATVSKKSIPALQATTKRGSPGSASIPPRDPAHAMRTAEKTPEERTREMNGVLKFCVSLPISRVDEYLKYADSSPYAYTTFANAMMA